MLNAHRTSHPGKDVSSSCFIAFERSTALVNHRMILRKQSWNDAEWSISSSFNLVQSFSQHLEMQLPMWRAIQMSPSWHGAQMEISTFWKDNINIYIYLISHRSYILTNRCKRRLFAIVTGPRTVIGPAGWYRIYQAPIFFAAYLSIVLGIFEAQGCCEKWWDTRNKSVG